MPNHFNKTRQYSPEIQAQLKQFALEDRMYQTQPARNKVVGNRYGRLEAIRVVGHTAKGKAFVLCHCDCGDAKIMTTDALKNGVKSCGCLGAERLGKKHQQVFLGLKRLLNESKKRSRSDS